MPKLRSEGLNRVVIFIIGIAITMLLAMCGVTGGALALPVLISLLFWM